MFCLQGVFIIIQEIWDCTYMIISENTWKKLTFNVMPHIDENGDKSDGQ